MRSKPYTNCLSSESYRWGNDRGIGVLTGWQHLLRHSGGGHLDDGCAGAEEVPWG
jgi:hypothetical protein